MINNLSYIFKDSIKDQPECFAPLNNYPFDTLEHTDLYDVYLNTDIGVKAFCSENANYIMMLNTGVMISWGKTVKENAEEFPVPNILDWEVTVGCKGVNGKVCPFCYKSNSIMHIRTLTFKKFKAIFDILPKSITQIAFGADATLEINPDLWKMMEYCRAHYVVPNITAAQINDSTADKLAKYCGAVAISRYNDKNACYDSIKKLTDRGMTQVNMHYMISEETYDRCIETLEDITKDPRLAKLNAIVLLSLKQKGRGTGYHPLSQEKFTKLVNYAEANKIGLGFDSCSSLKAFRSLQDTPEVRSSIIPCEASIESSYINVNGDYYPCSFTEGFKNDIIDWTKGISVTDCKSSKDFMEKVWFNDKTVQFKKLLKASCNSNAEHCRCCPLYTV